MVGENGRRASIEITDLAKVLKKLDDPTPNWHD
jgi:hypothetical protein